MYAIEVEKKGQYIDICGCAVAIYLYDIETKTVDTLFDSIECRKAPFFYFGKMNNFLANMKILAALRA